MNEGKIESAVANHIELIILLVLATITSMFIWISTHALDTTLTREDFLSKCQVEIHITQDQCIKLWSKLRRSG